jgi:hypothetical protein
LKKLGSEEIRRRLEKLDRGEEQLTPWSEVRLELQAALVAVAEAPYTVSVSQT